MSTGKFFCYRCQTNSLQEDDADWNMTCVDCGTVNPEPLLYKKGSTIFLDPSGSIWQRWDGFYLIDGKSVHKSVLW